MHDPSAADAPDSPPTDPITEPPSHELDPDPVDEQREGVSTSTGQHVDPAPRASPVAPRRRPARSQQVLTALVLVLIVASFVILAVEIASR